MVAPLASFTALNHIGVYSASNAFWGNTITFDPMRIMLAFSSFVAELA